MANYTKYYSILIANEGGYCDDPNDSGGETYRGIARKKNPQWSSWPSVDKIRLQHFPNSTAISPVPRQDWVTLSNYLEADPQLNDEVQSFYKPEYWDVMSLDQVNSQCIANQMADFGVNTGTERAAKMAQYVLKTKFAAPLDIDGKFGAHSVASLNAADQATFYAEYIAGRRAFYDYLAGSFPDPVPQELAAWHQFFHQEFGIVPNHDKYNRYLASWLSRTHEPFVA